MKLLYPQFLWALFALLIPLLIHLFNFRRHRTIFFSNTAFLSEIEKNTRSINRLRQLAILAARMLALAALVIAFAQPYLPVGDEGRQQERAFVSIYLDNSYSMKVNGSNGPLLNQARTQAAEFVKALPAQAKIQILSNSFESKNQRYYNKELALELIDKIEYSPAFRTWQDVSSRIREAWQTESPGDSVGLDLIVFSDLQLSAFESIDQQNLPAPWRLNLIRLEPANTLENIAIDSAWFSSPVLQPGFDQSLKIKLKNYSDKAFSDLNVQLEINDQTVGMSTISVPAQNNSTAEIIYQPPGKGYFQAKLKVDGGSPAFDNKFYFSFSTQKKARVLSAGKSLPHKKLRALFTDSLFDFQEEDLRNINYTQLPERDLILIESLETPSSGLVQALNQALENGNNVFLIPGENQAEFNAYLQALGVAEIPTLRNDTLRGSSINYDDPYFNQVFASRPKNPDLPSVFSYYHFNNNEIIPLLSLENGAPLLGYVPLRNGDLFISAVALQSEASSLVNHPLLTPILLNAALFQGASQHLYLRAGNAKASQSFTVAPAADEVLEIHADAQAIIPPQRKAQGQIQVFLPPREFEPGNYGVFMADSLVGHLSVNIDARESEFQYLNENELLASNKIDDSAVLEANAGGALALELEQRYHGLQLALWFILLALGFLILEIILIKFWRQ